MQGSSVGELDGELPLYRVLASLAAVTARGMLVKTDYTSVIIATTVFSIHHQEFLCCTRRGELPCFV